MSRKLIYIFFLYKHVIAGVIQIILQYNNINSSFILYLFLKTWKKVIFVFLSYWNPENRVSCDLNKISFSVNDPGKGASKKFFQFFSACSEVRRLIVLGSNYIVKQRIFCKKSKHFVLFFSCGLIFSLYINILAKIWTFLEKKNFYLLKVFISAKSHNMW